MFNLAVISDLVCIVIGLINGSVNVRDGGNEVRLSESACVTSDVSFSGNSLGIIRILERLNLPG